MRLRNVVTKLFCFLLAMTFFVNVGIAQVEANDAIEQEITSLWNEYVALFSNGRADLIAERIYTAPAYLAAGNGVQLMATEDDVRAAFSNMSKDLATVNYGGSKTKQLNICVLNDDSAILSAEYVRYRKDDSVLGEAAATYLVAKKSEGWRFIALLSHTVNEMIQCANYR